MCHQVFGSDSTQEKLFKQAIVPIVQEVMDGFNCTIFAYGQTGTGNKRDGSRDKSGFCVLSQLPNKQLANCQELFNTPCRQDVHDGGWST